MRRTAASKLGTSRPQLDRGGASLRRARRTAPRRGHRIGRPPRQHHRPGFGPPPRIWARATKQVDRGWEVINDLPEDIPVLPGELKVIEAYLAALLNESF
jgi:hypothetical protein